VEEQLRIASGEPLKIKQEDIKQQGHAIECRIYAEDPENNFLPCPGRMNFYHEPSGEHIRVDSGITGKPVIQSHFDPMISKLIVWGEDRSSARTGMIEALRTYIVHGIKNNISYLLTILNHDVFIRNAITTKYCDEHSEELMKTMSKDRQSVDPIIPAFSGLVASLNQESTPGHSIWGQIGYWRAYMQPQILFGEKTFMIHLKQYSEHSINLQLAETEYQVNYRHFPEGRLELQVDDNHYLSWVSLPEAGKVIVTYAGYTFDITRLDILPRQQEFSASETSLLSDIGNIVSPMPGRVIKIAVNEGDAVQKGDLLVVVEAMKMENNIMSPGDGVVDSISVSIGDLVDGSTRLIHLGKM
jgi:3-methylcrotonyl-CoA carboxylase alpha subunit